MRRHAATAAALIALAWIQVCPAALLAKPTRTVAGPAARKLIVAPPTLRASRERATRPPASAHAASRNAIGPERNVRSPRNSAPPTRASTAANRQSDPQTDRVPTRLHTRARTLEQERALAAQSAIAAADRQHRAVRPAPSAPHYAHNSLPPRPLSEVTATSDGPAAPSASILSSPQPGPDSPTALINIGGVLRPASGSLPLKSIEEEASTPVLLPPLRVSSLYDARGHLVVPKPLYGTREILLHQNVMADRDGLDRVRDDADLLDLRREKKLVALPDNETLRVDYRLPENRRFSRPWTAAFLTVLAADYYASFHSPLQVDSAVRTVAVQQRLIRTNGNAAPSTGDTASPHLTGQAVDIAKGGLSRIQIAWLRTYLQPLINLGKIDVEEEFQQSCFHISVYKNYLPIGSAHAGVADTRQLAPESLPERPIE
jgi:hypothetical protein